MQKLMEDDISQFQAIATDRAAIITRFMITNEGTQNEWETALFHAHECVGVE